MLPIQRFIIITVCAVKVLFRVSSVCSLKITASSLFRGMLTSPGGICTFPFVAVLRQCPLPSWSGNTAGINVSFWSAISAVVAFISPRSTLGDDVTCSDDRTMV